MSEVDHPRDQCQLAQRRCQYAGGVYRLGKCHQCSDASRNGALSGLLMGTCHPNYDVPSSYGDLSDDPLGSYRPYEVSRRQAQDQDAVCQ